MQLELKNSVALVTGSSRGIGRKIAETLHKEGCYVAMNARSNKDIESVAHQVGPDNVAGIQGDVTDPRQCAEIVTDVLARFGKLDILVCNVGSGASVKPGEETAEEWQRVFAVNLWSATNMVEAAKHALAESKGAIVCVSSICGIEVVPGAPVTYSAAKAALNAYVRGIARPLGRLGVRINAIAPGNILFEGSVWEHKLNQDSPYVERMLEENVALAELGKPSDVADFVAYLASPRAKFATGGVYVLDGGQVRS